MTTLTDEQYEAYDKRIMQAAVNIMQETYSDKELELVTLCKIYLRTLAAVNAEDAAIRKELKEKYKNDDDPPWFHAETGNALAACVGLKIMLGCKEHFVELGAQHGTAYKFNRELKALTVIASLIEYTSRFVGELEDEDNALGWTHDLALAEKLIAKFEEDQDESPTD